MEPAYYHAVIADLRSRAAEMLRHAQWLESQARLNDEQIPLLGQSANVGAKPYHAGMQIADACVAVLRKLGRPATNSEITATLIADGYVINSGHPVNNVGSCLNNRTNTKRDIIREGRLWVIVPQINEDPTHSQDPTQGINGLHK